MIVATRTEVDRWSYDPTTLLGGRYGEKDRITTISPPLQRLIDECGTLLLPGWEYCDGFHRKLSSPRMSDELSLVSINLSLGGISGEEAFAKVVACLKPELESPSKDGYAEPGWALPDSITHPLSDALQQITHYQILLAMLGFNPARYDGELFFQTGVLVFNLYLSDSRIQLASAEAEFRLALARLESLRQSAANQGELF